MSKPRLIAPREHGQILAVPAFDQISLLLEHNQDGRRSVNTCQVSKLGKSLNGVRELARREVLAASARYHHISGEHVPEVVSESWFVAGHQPELFHPGVWFKNFVLHHLARKHGAVALNLVVDTDTAKPAILQVPAEGRLMRVPYDRSSVETPYEERPVEDEELFASFAERLTAMTSTWGFEPMVASFWREVLKQAVRTRNLGERFAAARRTLERRWGVVQPELPMSRVCQTEAFAYFLTAILTDLPRFHNIYNQTVHEYRALHGIRSRNHPVPDLASDGDWLEAPFWAWRQGQSRRDRLFVRRSSSSWTLRIGNVDGPTIPADDLAALTGLESQGLKIRSRALTTTMFARLFLADLFIHGIGGGIYDELTDRILERFYGIPAPSFLTVSATVLLPLPRFPEAASQVVELSRKARDLIYKPELFVAGNKQTESLLHNKLEWIQRNVATHAERVQRFEQIRGINARLLPYVSPQPREVEDGLKECRQKAEWDKVAGRRDYSFCLYPEEMLRAFFERSAAP